MNAKGRTRPDAIATGARRGGKPAYRRPRLQRFGDVAELTAQVGTMGANDMNGNLKTA